MFQANLLYIGSTVSYSSHSKTLIYSLHPTLPPSCLHLLAFTPLSSGLQPILPAFSKQMLQSDVSALNFRYPQKNPHTVQIAHPISSSEKSRLSLRMQISICVLATQEPSYETEFDSVFAANDGLAWFCSPYGPRDRPID
jgi:hypothetical protein